MVRIMGDWQLGGPRPASIQVWENITNPAETSMRFDFSALGRWDTALMVFLTQCIQEARRKSCTVETDSFPAGIRKLMDLAGAVPVVDTGAIPGEEKLLHRLGQRAGEILQGMVSFLSFTGEIAVGIARLATGKKVFRPVDFMTNLYECSASALPIVGLISLLTGLTMAFVGAVQLQKFGAEIFVADLVGLSMVREMGALMAAIVMTGRTGAAFAAQLGNMRVSEEIDALHTMGIRPVDFLVVPRMLALVIMMPLLCMYANLIGILGGYLVGVLMLDMSTHQYITQTFNAMGLKDLFSGEIKSFFFGIVVAASGCFYGLMCGRSSAAVGRAVTRSVVTGIPFIIVVDAIFAVIFHILGI